MNVGSYIFSQVVDYIPRYQFDKLVAKYHGNWHSKDLTCYNQLLHLLFGQITGCGSLRDICLCLEAHKPILYHLGFRNTVTQPSLSRANENRDYRIYEGLGTYLISIVRPLYSKTAIPEITVDNVLYALDSTTISTSIKLATWALGKYSKGGVKMLYFEYLYLTRFYRISSIWRYGKIFLSLPVQNNIAGTASHRAWHRVTLKRQENESYSFERDRTGLS
jgi:hypothetical protein